MIFDLIKRAKQLIFDDSKSSLAVDNVQDAIDSIVCENNSVKEKLGISKNLLNYNYTPMSSIPKNGLTFSFNVDGSITVNGTATENTNLTLIAQLEEAYDIKQGSYFLTGCPTGGSEDTYYLRVEVCRENGGIYAMKDIGEGKKISITDDYSMIYSARIYVASGVPMNNVTFYPMIREAAEESSIYEPYREDRVAELENTVNNITDRLLWSSTAQSGGTEPQNITLPSTDYDYLEIHSTYQGMPIAPHVLYRGLRTMINFAMHNGSNSSECFVYQRGIDLSADGKTVSILNGNFILVGKSIPEQANGRHTICKIIGKKVLK